MCTPLNDVVTPQHLDKVLNKTLIPSTPPAFHCRNHKCGGFMEGWKIKDAGYWWYCASCGRGDDSISLYQGWRNWPDIHTAWLHLLQGAELSVAPALQSTKAVERHAQAVDRLRKLRAYLVESRGALGRDYPADSRGLMRKLNIYVPLLYPADFASRMGSYLGTHHRGLVALSREAGLSIPNKGFSGTLRMVMEAAPGLPAGLVFIRERDIVAMPLGEDAGIAGLCTLDPKADDVVVVPDMQLFLRAQFQSFHGLHKPAPIIFGVLESDATFENKTTNAWQCLIQKRVIFWDPGRGAETINVARKFGARGYVAYAPELPRGTAATTLLSGGLADLLATWRESAVPWTVALKKILVAARRSDAFAVMEKLEPLRTDELEEVRKVCSAIERVELDFILQSKPQTRTFVFDDKVYAEYPDKGWFRLSHQGQPGEGHEELVAEATPVFHHTCLVNDKVYYAGDIRFKGHVIPFSASREELDDGCPALVERLCMRHGVGAPRFGADAKRLLLNLSLSYQTPVVVQTPTRIGWNPTLQAYELPQFLLHKSGITEDTPRPVTGRLPGEKLQPSNPPLYDQVKGLFTPSVENQVAWATLIAVAANLRASASGGRRCGTALIDEHGLGVWTASEMGRLLNLVSWNGDSELDQLRAMESYSDLPAVCRGMEGPAWEAYLRTQTSGSLLSVCGLRKACSLAMTGSWNFIDARDREFTAAFPSGVAAFLVPYLAWATKRNEAPPVGRPWTTSVLLDVCTFLSALYPAAPIRNLRNAMALRVRPGGLTANVGVLDKFLDTVILEVNLGRIQTGRADVREDRNLPLIASPDDQRLKLNLRVIYKLLEDDTWLTDPARLEMAFRETLAAEARRYTDGWSIRQDYFDRKFSTFRALYFSGG